MKRSTLLYVMLAFPLLWFLIFCYLPMFGIVIAFKDYNLYKGIMASPWIGLKHFNKFLSDPYFWKVFSNTFKLGFANILINFPAPIILALLFNELKKGIFKNTVQTISYLPHFVSSVALVNIVILMMSPSMGIINNIIKAVGLQSVNFIIEKEWFLPIYILTLMWREIGWGTIIYLAAMSGIDPELYNVAEIDGAGRFRKVWNITIPSIMPVIGIMLILAIPGILGAYVETVLLLQLPITYDTSDVVATYIYRRGILNGQFDYATAIGFMFSLIGIGIIYISNRLGRKYAETSLW